MRSTGSAKIFFKSFLEEPAIRQPRQRVVSGKFACFEFRADARVYFPGKVAITPKRINHHGNAHDEHDENHVAELKQLGSKIVGMGNDVSDSCRRNKDDGISNFGTSPIKPIYHEAAR